MTNLSKKEIKEYDKQIMKKAKKFKLKPRDFHNLFDLFYMVDNPPEMEINLRKTLKLNNMDKWFDDFHARVERVLFDKDLVCKKFTRRKI